MGLHQILFLSFCLQVEFGPGGAAEDPELYEAMHGFLSIFVEKKHMQESVSLAKVSISRRPVWPIMHYFCLYVCG